MKRIFIALLFFLPGIVSAKEVLVSDPETARKAVLEASPGDVIILKSGEWKDADLRFDGAGEDGKPITIRAEDPGKTVITGASRIRLGGEYLVVSGLWLKNISGSHADWLQYRIDSKRMARHCRVTDCAFTEDAAFTPQEEGNRWIGFYGADNRLDQCWIEGKKNEGATAVIWLSEGDAGRHQLRLNYFGERPRLGKNGGETIRVGDSKTSMLSGNCLVEGNVFYRCDGEVECISNKSCENTYRGNFFHEVQGTLTLRHGNNCRVEANVFLGKMRSQTGGIRIIGEGHAVIGNFLKDLEGEKFRSAISLINGIPDSPANGYFQVKRAVIRDNTIINCKESLLIGHHCKKEASLPPLGCRFEGNRINARSRFPAVRVGLTAIETVWEGNLFSGDLEGLESSPGLLEVEPGAITAPVVPRERAVGVTWRTPAR